MEETTLNIPQIEPQPIQPERPDFLKILCILSFVGCGLMILIYAVGTMCLALDESMVEETWAKVVEANPKFGDMSAGEFFHNIGMLCFCSLVANIISLVGVIMMWRLDKVGFYVYSIAELSTNFFGLAFNFGEEQSYGGMILGIVLDLIFIVMYFMNLKYMTRRTSTHVKLTSTPE